MSSLAKRELRKAYSPSYFCLDNMLACQTLVPCMVVEKRLPKFGFLVPGCNSEDLPRDVRLQLPLWAARVMSRPSRVYVSISIPPGYQGIIRQVDDPDAAVVDLKKINPRYFEAGYLCTFLYHNDARLLADTLSKILEYRIISIAETTLTQPRGLWAQQIKKKADPELMDILEEQLYRVAKNGSDGLEDWLDCFKDPTELDSSSESSAKEQIQSGSCGYGNPNMRQKQEYQTMAIEDLTSSMASMVISRI